MQRSSDLLNLTLIEGYKSPLRRTVHSALCQNCYGKIIKKIEAERKNIDTQRKDIEERLQNSFIDNEYSKLKKLNEECKYCFLIIWVY